MYIRNFLSRLIFWFAARHKHEPASPKDIVKGTAAHLYGHTVDSIVSSATNIALKTLDSGYGANENRRD